MPFVNICTFVYQQDSATVLEVCTGMGINGFPCVLYSRGIGNKNVAQNGNWMGTGSNAMGIGVDFTMTLPFPSLISSSQTPSLYAGCV